MANSPTICQKAVAHAIHIIRRSLKGHIDIYHCVDDLMVLMDTLDLLMENMPHFISGLQEHGFTVAPDNRKNRKGIEYIPF